ncbi:MAG TPA: NAD(P)-dependent oxidoreductase [Bacteroidota bacterium]
MTASRALVTGASGFIGRHLCSGLVEKDFEVHAVSRHEQKDKTNGISWRKADLSVFSEVEEVVNSVRPDLIFHLAGEVTGTRKLEYIVPTFQANLASTVYLMTKAAGLGCERFILTGSLEEPDPGAPAVPSSPYAAAKWSASGYARMFWELYRLPVSIARLFMVYGPAQRDTSKLVPFVILSLLKGEAPKLSSGQRAVDWIYVEDVVDGLVMMADAPGIEGRTVELGSGHLVTIRQVVEEITRLIGSQARPLFGALPERPMEQVRVADVEDSYRKIAWKPKTSLTSGLRQTIDWYSSQTTAERGK